MRLVLTFGVLLIVGMGLTLPLYKLDFNRYRHSIIFIKTLFWIPIFVLFIGFLYTSPFIQLGLLLGLVVLAGNEMSAVVAARKDSRQFWLYFAALAVALLHLLAYPLVFDRQAISYFIAIAIASVLSDVAAFFAGKYAGHHHLPKAINDQKSWEGVAGQLLGALIGVIIVRSIMYSSLPILLFWPIGLGAAGGDLCNSYFKRQAGIKDWSSRIPGHGGLVDRLSSLSGSLLLAFYFLLALKLK